MTSTLEINSRSAPSRGAWAKIVSQHSDSRDGVQACGWGLKACVTVTACYFLQPPPGWWKALFNLSPRPVTEFPVSVSWVLPALALFDLFNFSVWKVWKDSTYILSPSPGICHLLSLSLKTKSSRMLGTSWCWLGNLEKQTRLFFNVLAECV